MTTITHSDSRVSDAFEARRDAKLGHAEWRTIGTAGLIPNETDYMRVNLEIVEYPAWHALGPLVAYKVSMHGDGDFSGQKKSSMMRSIVKEYTGLKRSDIEWIMVSTGGIEPHFWHTWYVFSETELRSAQGMY